MPLGGQVPDDTTLLSLLLAFLRGDMEGAAVIMEGQSLPLLLSDALAMINRIGVDDLGAEGWEARLAATLADAARRG
ncbi:hypothetical protein [Micromonospora chersina]|uniref:hypothetical protein n=1 Tax=Micromonospora chersina TaxID=47854 RepID=UPI0037207963